MLSLSYLVLNDAACLCQINVEALQDGGCAMLPFMEQPKQHMFWPDMVMMQEMRLSLCQLQRFFCIVGEMIAGEHIRWWLDRCANSLFTARHEVQYLLTYFLQIDTHAFEHA